MKKKFNFYSPFTWISLGFGSGLSPVAPGTIGSLFALVLYIFLIDPFILTSIDTIFLVVFIFLAYILGVLSYRQTVDEEKDPSFFVWDEFVGMWIACLPFSFFNWNYSFLAISFMMFRLLDILKPWPIYIIDKKKGSSAVMLDDVVAGIISIPCSVLIYILISYSS